MLHGLWFDSDEQLWLWLDRTQDRLYGPELAQQLEWLEAVVVVEHAIGQREQRPNQRARDGLDETVEHLARR